MSGRTRVLVIALAVAVLTLAFSLELGSGGAAAVAFPAAFILLMSALGSASSDQARVRPLASRVTVRDGLVRACGGCDGTGRNKIRQGHACTSCAGSGLVVPAAAFGKTGRAYDVPGQSARLDYRRIAELELALFDTQYPAARAATGWALEELSGPDSQPADSPSASPDRKQFPVAGREELEAAIGYRGGRTVSFEDYEAAVLALDFTRLRTGERWVIRRMPTAGAAIRQAVEEHRLAVSRHSGLYGCCGLAFGTPGAVRAHLLRRYAAEKKHLIRRAAEG